VLSKFWYLARYRAPSEEVVRQLVILQSHVVWKNDVPEELESAKRVAGWMKDTAATLPIKAGGLNVVDIRTKLRAIRAEWVVKLLTAPVGLWAVLPLQTLRATLPMMEAWPLVSHQKSTRKLVLAALKALPTWQEAVSVWFQATLVIRLHRTELPDQKVDLVAMPLALRELAGFPTPPYTQRLKDGQWYHL
jgi:hypothetical protein